MRRRLWRLGIITRGYDGLDRLSSETTPQGSIGYTYDNASRRATMQVAGQTQVGYMFDNANRLTQIAQGTSTVGFTYDNANRRSTLTLPNGIVATYSYDNDSHLAGISYALNSTSVGVLNYGYDALGMRTSVSGSMARIGLPQPIPSASYDSGNELLAWNETALSYDSNGNMLSDGTHNYAWDARNHLSTIDAGSTGSFVYDPSGRRATKVISSTSTSFLYDRANPMQELSGMTPTANLLTGGLDEYFARTDASGTSNFLTDALGSTAALSDPTGTVQTQDTFDPFGNTSQSGVSTTSSYAYTGREADGTSLYYYRARYYNPQLGRFISEDPMGFAGGVNFYSYVRDTPTNSVDPLGLADDSNLQPCGVDCVHTPDKIAAIQREHDAFMLGLDPPAVSAPPNPMAGRACGCPDRHISMGTALNGAFVVPTSGGGGIRGLNFQSFGPNTNAYTYGGGGLGWDVGASIQSVWALGSGPWTGQFRSISVSASVFSGSLFWTPGKCGWTGFSFGPGLGTPGGALEVTNYSQAN
jgi:RHS repeat-associated protein